MSDRELSFWLEHPLHLSPSPHYRASFVEYLRWMRVRLDENDNANKTINSGTLLQLFHQMRQTGDWEKDLTRLTDRTKKLAGNNWFEVTCPWRIRVGGTKGPESMLLPAFDALGMPYIPSSTLKGVARNAAKRHLSEAEVKDIFGQIDPATSMGKVIFLDAYPLPGEDLLGGLSPDIANAIRTWDRDDALPEYGPNPNLFLSLEKPTFVIGLRRGTGCSEEVLRNVAQWLKEGLVAGVGAGVNSGYGTLKADVPPDNNSRILQVPFELEGQLIHGQECFQKWEQKNGKWKSPGRAVEELRPIAFRSMLRYWFRSLAAGVLPLPDVRRWEKQIFGGIEPEPAQTGWFRVEILNPPVEVQPPQKESDLAGMAAGTLILRLSPYAASDRQKDIKFLLANLTWLMFHLGGVGQGARRPCYSRKTRDTPPWWRGASLRADSSNNFWKAPGSLEDFQSLFRKRLSVFYKALGGIVGANLNYNAPLEVPLPSGDRWVEACDRHCRIVCVSGKKYKKNPKPFALAVLHDLARRNYNGYNPLLCGGTQPKVISSPVWIAEVENYQVVTVFGANAEPRQGYLRELENNANSLGFSEIWPVPPKKK